MHFAAFAYVGESVADPELYYRNNVVGTLALLEAMREAGVDDDRLLLDLRDYGMPASVPIGETTAAAGQPLRRDQAGDRAGAALVRRGAYGLRYAALRYFNAAGADPDGEIGEDHEPETHLIPLVLQAALGRGEPVEIYGTDYPTPDGTAIRDYIHVTDLADAHVRAFDHLAAGGDSAALNLGTGSGHSVREVIAAVERVRRPDGAAPRGAAAARRPAGAGRRSRPRRARFSAGAPGIPISKRSCAPPLPGRPGPAAIAPAAEMPRRRPSAMVCRFA